MDLEEMKWFKMRAMEIVRNSRNPARCLQLMQVKAGSILGVHMFSGRKACSSPELSLPPKGATTVSDEGIQSDENWESARAAETCVIEPTAALPVVTAFEAPGRRHGVVSDPGEVHLGATDEAVGVDSDEQDRGQLCDFAEPGVQQIKEIACSVYNRSKCIQFDPRGSEILTDWLEEQKVATDKEQKGGDEVPTDKEQKEGDEVATDKGDTVFSLQNHHGKESAQGGGHIKNQDVNDYGLYKTPTSHILACTAMQKTNLIF